MAFYTTVLGALEAQQKEKSYDLQQELLKALQIFNGDHLDESPRKIMDRYKKLLPSDYLKLAKGQILDCYVYYGDKTAAGNGIQAPGGYYPDPKGDIALDSNISVNEKHNQLYINSGIVSDNTFMRKAFDELYVKLESEQRREKLPLLNGLFSEYTEIANNFLLANPKYREAFVDQLFDLIDYGCELGLENKISNKDLNQIIQVVLAKLQAPLDQVAQKPKLLTYLLNDNFEQSPLYKYKSLRKILKQYMLNDQGKDFSHFVLNYLFEYREVDLLVDFIINEKSSKTLSTPLSKCYLVIDTLLKNGLDSPYVLQAVLQKFELSIQDLALPLNEEQENILHLCAKYNSSNVLRYVLVNTNEQLVKLAYATNKDGDMPIHVAARNQNMDLIADMYFESGMDLSAASAHGDTVNSILGTKSKKTQLTKALSTHKPIRPRKPIRSILFEGGGVKGNTHVYALLTAVKHLGLIEPEVVETYSGTSAGSINAFALACGLSVEEMLELVEEKVNFAELADVNTKLQETGEFGKYKIEAELLAKEVIALVKKGVSLDLIWNGSAVWKKVETFLAKIAAEKGICDGEKLTQLFRDTLNSKLRIIQKYVDPSENMMDSIIGSKENTVETMEIQRFLREVLNSKDPRDLTLGEMKKLIEFTHAHPNIGVTFNHMRVPAVCTEERKLYYFRTDTDDQKILDVPAVLAIRASMSIPVFFKECEIKINGEKKHFVDGGTVYNFPYELAKENYSAEEVLGFKLGFDMQGQDEKPKSVEEVIQHAEKQSAMKTIIEFVKGDLVAQLLPLLKVQGVRFDANEKIKARAARLDNAEVGTIDFDLKLSQRKRQKYAAGYSIKRFMDVELQKVSANLSPRVVRVLTEFMSSEVKAINGLVKLNTKLNVDSPSQVLKIYANASTADLPILRRIVNPNLKNSDGITALHLAEAYGFKETARLLKTAGANQKARPERHVDYQSKKGLKENFGIELPFDTEEKYCLTIESMDAAYKQIMEKSLLEQEQTLNQEKLEALNRQSTHWALKLEQALLEQKEQLEKENKEKLLHELGQQEEKFSQQRQKLLLEKSEALQHQQETLTRENRNALQQQQETLVREKRDALQQQQEALAREKREALRQQQERLEQEKRESLQQQQERLTKGKTEALQQQQERLEQEKREALRQQQERLEQEKREALQLQKDRLAKEKTAALQQQRQQMTLEGQSAIDELKQQHAAEILQLKLEHEKVQESAGNQYKLAYVRVKNMLFSRGQHLKKGFWPSVLLYGTALLSGIASIGLFTYLAVTATLALTNPIVGLVMLLITVTTISAISGRYMDNKANAGATLIDVAQDFFMPIETDERLSSHKIVTTLTKGNQGEEQPKRVANNHLQELQSEFDEQKTSILGEGYNEGLTLL